MSEKAKRTSASYLKKLDVQLFTQTVVKNYDGKKVTLSDGKEIETETVIWAAGVTYYRSRTARMEESSD